MLNQPTIEKLQAMKLHGMVDAFRQQIETPGFQPACLRSDSIAGRSPMAMEGEPCATRRLQLARFKERGTVEDIDYQHPWARPKTDAHARHQRMGTAASKPTIDWANRD